MDELKKELNCLHRLLRKAKYFYYERDNEKEDIMIMSDYEFDMKEKRYDELCNQFNIPMEMRVSEQVGWSPTILMNLFYDENKESI